MASDNQPKIRVRPFTRGQLHQGRVVVRTFDDARYLSLSAAELAVLEQMVGLDISIETYVKWHLAGQEGLSFREAVMLISRLNTAGFLEDERAEKAMPRLESLASPQSSRLHTFANFTWSKLFLLFDMSLADFGNAQPSKLLTGIGRVLNSPAFFFLTIVALGFSVKSFQSISTYGHSALLGMLRTPEWLLAQFYLAFLTVNMLLGFLCLALLSGTGAQCIPVSLRLSLLAVPRLVIKDDDAQLLTTRQMIRFWGSMILWPWIFGAACWFFAGPAFLQILSCAFLVMGVLYLCPLYTSPLVRLSQGLLGRRDILGIAKQYLGSQLLQNIWRRSSLAPKQRFDRFLGAFAAFTLLWLYGVSLLFTDTLSSALPPLYHHVFYGAELTQRLAALSLLAILGGGLLLVVLDLLKILGDNIVAAAELPARKARQGIESFYRTYSEPTEAVAAFFRDIPIFAHLTENQILQLSQKLRSQTFRKGQTIIKQGEEGREFFIVGAGEAQIILEHDNGFKELVGVLKPGDSFGEISLIEHSPRTATVRATDETRMFVLGAEEFNSLFPEDSSERKHLTFLIRRVKLILDSQALSHLGPPQIHELLRCADTVEFVPGTTIVREGDIGDAAYLIESGKARVCLPGNEMPAAYLQKGDLIGIISLIKGIKRTADVVAETSVTALKIDRAIFLRVCMSDVFVAMLMSDLSDKQLAKRKAA